jgi:xylulokinase
MAVIGLDVGTTCCKCGVYSDEGKLICIKSSEYDVVRLKGEQYIDTKALWQNVKKILAEAAKGNDIKGISVSSLGEAFVPVDKNFNILGNSMLYTDTRGIEDAEFLSGNFGEEKFVKITGCMPHCMYSLPKMMWLKKNQTDVYKKADYFLLIADFINFMLCGERAIDYSLAARTAAFDIVNKNWNKKILEFADIDVKKLSKSYLSGTIIGEIRKVISEELGISKSCKIITGGHDQVCSALGAGVISKGSSVDGTGTVECITPVFDKPVTDFNMADCGYSCVPYAIENHYVTYLLNYNGGALLKWFKDNLQKEHLKILKEKQQSFFDYYNSMFPKNPTNLLVLPYFSGAATPYMNLNAKGAVINLTMATTSFEIYRALMEGATYEMRLNSEKVKEYGIDIDELTVTGGGANSKEWLQIKADIMQIPVYPLETVEAGINGAAMLALKGLCLIKNFEEGKKILVSRKNPIFPKVENLEFYDKQYEKYKKIYKNLKEFM